MLEIISTIVYGVVVIGAFAIGAWVLWNLFLVLLVFIDMILHALGGTKNGSKDTDG